MRSATEGTKRRSDEATKGKTHARSLLLATLIAILVSLTGCPYANPHTTFRAGPYYFDDTKDNDVELVDFEYREGEAKIGKLTIRNNASDVRRANVEQIQAQTEQTKAITAMITLQTQAMTGMMSRLAPFLFPATSIDATTPWGGIKAGTKPAAEATKGEEGTKARSDEATKGGE